MLLLCKNAASSNALCSISQWTKLKRRMQPFMGAQTEQVPNTKPRTAHSSNVHFQKLWKLCRPLMYILLFRMCFLPLTCKLRHLRRWVGFFACLFVFLHRRASSLPSTPTFSHRRKSQTEQLNSYKPILFQEKETNPAFLYPGQQLPKLHSRFA